MGNLKFLKIKSLKCTSALWAVVSEIWADFQNCHIWAGNLAIGQSSRSCILILYLVSETQADFQNTIAIFGYKTWTLTKKIHKFHIYQYSLSTSWELKLSFFLLCGQWFPRHSQIFKIAIFGHETWPLAKGPEVACILSFYTKGSKLILFSLYGQQFLRYGLIFKIAIFMHET